MNKKDCYYFSHDSNASQDPKIMVIKSVYGWQGVGWFWRIIELLRNDPDFTFPLEKLQIIALSKELDTNIEMLQKYLQTCFEVRLFVQKDGFLYSQSLNRRMEVWESKRRLLSDRGAKGADARWHKQCLSNAKPMLTDGKERKVEESRVKEKKEERESRFAPPSPLEVTSYFEELQHPLEAERFTDYYTSNGWRVGRSKMKDWRAAARGWASRSKDFSNPKRESEDAYIAMQKKLGIFKEVRI